MTKRIARVSEALKREISVIIQFEIDDARLFGVTITRVEVTRDLSWAKIFFMPPEEETPPAEFEKLFRRYTKFIRGELSRRVPLKFMPMLSFREDDIEKHRRSVDLLFEKIKKEEKRNEPERNGSGDR